MRVLSSFLLAPINQDSALFPFVDSSGCRSAGLCSRGPPASAAKLARRVARRQASHEDVAFLAIFCRSASERPSVCRTQSAAQ